MKNENINNTDSSFEDSLSNIAIQTVEMLANKYGITDVMNISNFTEFQEETNLDIDFSYMGFIDVLLDHYNRCFKIVYLDEDKQFIKSLQFVQDKCDLWKNDSQEDIELFYQSTLPKFPTERELLDLTEYKLTNVYTPKQLAYMDTEEMEESDLRKLVANLYRKLDKLNAL
jgi:hypothetical protein